MKKILIVFTTVIMMLLMTNRISAETSIIEEGHPEVFNDVPSISGTPSVYDAAGLLSSEQFDSLTLKLDEIRRRQNMDVVVVTAQSLYGMSPRDYADDFYDYNNYRNDGILLLVSMENRDWYISTKGKGIDYFTDYGIDLIADKVVSRLSKGKYYEAFNIFADQADYFIEEAKSGNIIDIDNDGGETGPRSFGIFNGVISTVVGALSSLFTSLILKGQMKSIQKHRYAGSYVVDRSFVLTGRSDLLVDRKVSRVYNPPNRNSGGSHSGGSSVHTSSSGSSHGGHGGHF